MDKSILLFVYGTLRKRGVANHFLQDYQVKEENVWVNGFEMYDAGWYPFALPTGEDKMILGDLYEIPEWKLEELDEYEGPEYKKMHIASLKAIIYVKADMEPGKFKKLTGGDWLAYWEMKNG